MTVADMEELKALAASMIANGEFDKPAYVDHRFDLNADGVMDPIAVAPGACLDGNGTVSVIDGAVSCVDRLHRSIGCDLRGWS